MLFIAFLLTIEPMSSFEKKIEKLGSIFKALTVEEKYKKIIQYGLEKAPQSDTSFAEDEIVEGCQSTLYLKSAYENGKVFFKTHSDALISKGLARLLTEVYSGESPAFIIQQKPSFLLDLGIYDTLSPSRSNGVQALYLKMQKECIKYLI